MAGPNPFSSEERGHAWRGKIMKTVLYIGPLIERGGKFSYDTFSPTEGLRSSFRYQRVEEARYDRRAMVAEAGSGLQSDVHVCETLAEFEQLVEAARNAAADSGELKSAGSQRRLGKYGYTER
jgi:hypothetical protein